MADKFLGTGRTKQTEILSIDRQQVGNMTETALNPEIKNWEKYLQQRASAAAAAVAIALEAEHNTIKEYPLPPKAAVSAWQAVLRPNLRSTRKRIR